MVFPQMKFNGFAIMVIQILPNASFGNRNNSNVANFARGD